MTWKPKAPQLGEAHGPLRCPDCREVESQVCNLHGMGDMDETDKRIAALEAEKRKLLHCGRTEAMVSCEECLWCLKRKARALAHYREQEERYAGLLGLTKHECGVFSEDIGHAIQRLTRERDEARQARRIAEEDAAQAKERLAIEREHHKGTEAEFLRQVETIRFGNGNTMALAKEIPEDEKLRGSDDAPNQHLAAGDALTMATLEDAAKRIMDAPPRPPCGSKERPHIVPPVAGWAYCVNCGAPLRQDGGRRAENEQQDPADAPRERVIPNAATRREPAPIPNGSAAPNVTDLVIQDLRDRDQPGIEKYGTPLQPRNGRNPLVDGYQEFLDGAKYFRLALEDYGEAFEVFALLRRAMGDGPAEKGAVLGFARGLVGELETLRRDREQLGSEVTRLAALADAPEAQRNHLPTLRWLIGDGPRGAGRSWLLAQVFLEKALQHPGRRIRVFDHVPDRGAHLRLLDIILSIAESLRLKGISVDSQRLEVRAELQADKAVAP